MHRINFEPGIVNLSCAEVELVRGRAEADNWFSEGVGELRSMLDAQRSGVLVNRPMTGPMVTGHQP